MIDIVYKQPVKELLQISAYFKEKVVVLVENEIDEQVARKKEFIPCYLVDEKTDLNKIKKKKKAVFGCSVKNNEFAVRIKADFLLQPSNEKQFFDLGLAKKLADNNIVVVLMFEELLQKNSFERHLYWKNYLEVVKYCKKKNTKFIVASGCKDSFNLKHPVIRKSLVELLGFEKEMIEKSFEGLL
jgi:RNase P/RNase MRP subunit p30